jgi:hypothetical protein
MKTLETLNSKRVDIFPRFAANICVSHIDKPSNSYGHWKTARGEIFDEKLKTDWVFEDGKRFGSTRESRQQIEWEEDSLWSFPIRLHAEAGMRNAGVVEFSWRWMTISKERLRSGKYEGLEGLLRWRVLFGMDGGLGSLIYWVFKLGFFIAQRWWSEIGQLKDQD